MSNFDIAIRKNIEYHQVQYWLIIKAKNILDAVPSSSPKDKFSSKRQFILSIDFIDTQHWIVFLAITVMINTLITVNYFFREVKELFVVLMIVAHLTCLIYWIDFVAALIKKIIKIRNKSETPTRSIYYCLIDGISLLPLSTIYFIIKRDIYTTTFWLLRLVTLLRFYRIWLFINQITTAGRNYWTNFIIGYIIYLSFAIIIFANIFFVYYNNETNVYQWNETVENRFLVLLYFAATAFLNVGMGDIPLTNYWERITVAVAIFFGNTITSGVITGTLAIQFSSKYKKRELFRHEYRAVKLNLKEMNIEKRTVDKISENMQATWKYKTGHLGVSSIQLMPMALQKEILFDINYGYLKRSLIFSRQPRAFLRSVAINMKNISYLPGDIISESFGMAEAMFCVASGVIEILSEENDETPILSLTNGTILSEAALFITIPNRCIIRAATYVELQVLMKVHFARVALRYKDIFRNMQAQIYSRVKFKEEPESEVKTLDSDFYNLSRRKATKRLIQDLKRHRKEEVKGETSYRLSSPILNLYVWSENLPRVKILPINLVQGKSWILRPESFFLNVWEGCILVVINVVAYLYPYLVAFHRKISSFTYLCMVIVDLFYISDLVVQCLTAIETKDKFSYIYSISKILQHKLRTVGFYLDIFATYQFNIYSNLLWSEESDYAYLILSMNRLVKWWRMVQFFERQENNLNRNYLMITFVKYIYYCTIFTWWLSAVLYLEACPEDRCEEERWFSQFELKKVKPENPSSVTNWPDLVSTYLSIIMLYGVGYGDITPTAVIDCIFIVIVAIIGCALLCFTMAAASSTMKNLSRHRTNYQEEIFAVDRFMEEHDLPKVFKLRVKNYFRLQWDYDEAFTLKHPNVAEGLHGPQKTIVLNQLMKKFLAVPIFQDADHDFLRMLTKSCKLCILPPQEVIIQAGSCVREMYILESGFCAISKGEVTDTVRIIGPVNSFGFIEMILGTPIETNIKTITHARIMYLEYSAYLRAVTKFPDMKKQIDIILKTNYEPDARTQWDTLGFEPLEERILRTEILNLQEEVHTANILNVYKHHKILGLSYWKPFEAWKKFRMFQFLLLPYVILPHSVLIKIWMPLRIINVFLIGIISPIHFCFPQDTSVLHVPLIIMFTIIHIDMYMMFHVAYYNKQGLLVYHPAKTAVYYLKGNFLLDFITGIPFHLILPPVKPEEGNFFYGAPALIVALQFYKFWQACYYLEGDITRKTYTTKILKFIPLTFVVTSLITGLLIMTECNNIPKSSTGNYTNLSLEYELTRGFELYCKQEEPVKRELQKDNLSAFKLYIIVYYWVTYTMLQIGFGDVTDHNFRALVFIIILTALGVLFYTYMFGSLTSSLLSIYNVITNHRKMLLEMVNFMTLKRVSERKKKRVVLHYEYTWVRTEGKTPQNMLTYVHTALRETILTKMYEATIRQVPAFAEIDKSLIKLIARNLHEIYFLRGETIVNYRDAQEYIYLIYRGKVDVMSHTGELVTSLKSGGLFGNIANKPFCLSSLRVTAVQNVDILIVDSAVFFKTLQVFPKAKSLLDYLVSQENDFIEPLTKSDISIDDLDTVKYGKDTIPFEIRKLRKINPDMNFSSIDLKKSGDYFYFYNSIYKDPQKSLFTFVILPTSVLYKIIDVCTVLMAYCSFFITLYMFSFQDLSLELIIKSYVMDVFFWFKLYLQFHLSFTDKHGDFIVNVKLIRHRYFKSKVTLAIDILSNIPFEIFATLAEGEWFLKWLSILRLNKLLRFRYILDFYNSKFNVLMINKITLHLSYIIIAVSLMVHVFSCAWFIVACPIGFVQPNTWFTIMNLQNVEKWKVYVIACYFTCTLFTTTGFGDIPIFSTAGLMITIVNMVFSRFGLAWIAGGMASIAEAQGLSLVTYQERITELKASFIRQNISDYQLAKMWYYVSALWLHNEGKQIPELITTAPYAMKCDIMNEMFGSHLSESYPFSEMEDAFLRQLTSFLKRNVFFPGNYIVHQGDIDRTMYFIHKGQVLVLTIRPDMMETIHFKLTANDHFGMTQGLILGKPHAFSYRAETEVEILSLTLNHWDHLFRYFPDIKEKIYKRIDNITSVDSKTLNFT